MRYLFGFMCVCALGVVPLLGCGQSPGLMVDAFPCTEQGIRDAIAEGGGPHTFDCDGATRVVTAAEIVIDNDVILDGEGNLAVDGGEGHRVLSIPEGVAAELRGLSVRGGMALVGDVLEVYGGGIENSGDLTLTNSTVSGNSAASGGGIANTGTLTLVNSTVSGNSGARPTFNGGGGIINGGTLTLINSTVSGNSGNVGGGISNGGTLTLMQSTVSGNDAALGGGGILNYATMMMTNCTLSGNSGNAGGGIYTDGLGESTLTGSVVDGDCTIQAGATLTSTGYNLESPNNTCGFDQITDQVNVTAEDLKLGPLRDNGGPTMTQALGAGSVAIGHIPAVDCQVTEDQRGQPRPETGGDACDVGSFERQPEDP